MQLASLAAQVMSLNQKMDTLLSGGGNGTASHDAQTPVIIDMTRSDAAADACKAHTFAMVHSPVCSTITPAAHFLHDPLPCPTNTTCNPCW